MRPYTRKLALLAWFLLLVPSGAAVAEESADKPERSWKAQNVRWTLPGEGWRFEDVSTEQKGYGYFTRVLPQSDAVEFYAGAKSAGGLTLSHLSLEMLEEGRDEFDNITSFNQGTGKLSSLDGIHVWVRGTIGGSEAYVSYHCILVKGVFYFFFTRCWGGSEESWAADLEEVRKGLRLIKMPKQRGKVAEAPSAPPSAVPSDVPSATRGPAGVSGPISGLVEASTEARGEFAGVETEVRRMAVILTKPVSLASIEPTGYQVGAFETRADKSSYFYFDAVSEPKREKTKDDLPAYVEERAQEWLKAAGATAKIGSRKNDVPRFKKGQKWSKGKGLCWNFTGEHAGVPFSEHGWVVIYKQRIFIIRAQFGGEGAPKKYKALLKKLQKNWIFE